MILKTRVHANARAGYRTYSQMTMSPARAGDWRVELRTVDGTVLPREALHGRPVKPAARLRDWHPDRSRVLVPVAIQTCQREEVPAAPTVPLRRFPVADAQTHQATHRSS